MREVSVQHDELQWSLLEEITQGNFRSCSCLMASSLCPLVEFIGSCSDGQMHLQPCTSIDADSRPSPPGSPITPQVHLTPHGLGSAPLHTLSPPRSAAKSHDTMLLLQYFISQRGCSIWKNTIETDHSSPALPWVRGRNKDWLPAPPSVSEPHLPLPRHHPLC